MPRLPRYFAPGLPQHVIQRGNNRCVIFAEEFDFLFFRSCLSAACERHACEVHAYVLMTNHVHLLATPLRASAIGKVMQSVGRRYVRYFNDRYCRTGGLWEGRYRSTIVDTVTYLFTCYRYIELNPVRARLSSDPGGYPWSSYRFNALGAPDPIVVPHELYSSLDRDLDARRVAYRSLFDVGIDEETLRTIRDSTNKGWALGSERFRREIAKLLSRRVTPLRAMRPAPVESTNQGSRA